MTIKTDTQYSREFQAGPAAHYDKLLNDLRWKGPQGLSSLFKARTKKIKALEDMEKGRSNSERFSKPQKFVIDEQK